MAAIVSSDSAPKRELSTKQIFIFSLSGFGLFLTLALMNGFSFYFMTYVLGLDAFLAGIGITINGALSAITSIIFGYASDQRKPGKWGKRRFYYLTGTPIFVIANFLLWFYPEWLQVPAIGQIGVAIYYWIIMAIFTIFCNYVWAPWNGMIPEISETEQNRIKLSGISGIFSMFASVFGVATPIIFKSLFSPVEMIVNIRYFALLVSIITTAFIYLMFFTIKDPSVENRNTTLESSIGGNINNETKKSVKDMVVDVVKPLKNKNFQQYQTYNFIFNIGIKIPLTILIPFISIVVLIPDEQLPLYIIIIAPFGVLGFLLWTWLAAHKGLVKTLIIATYFGAISMCSSFLFLFPLTEIIRIAVGLFVVCSAVLSLISSLILPNPIISEIIDEEVDLSMNSGAFKDPNDKYKFAGSFFGINSFMINLAAGASSLLLGTILSGREDDPTTIALLMPLTGLFLGITIIWLKKIHLRTKK